MGPAVDPLNLGGTLMDGAKVPPLPANRIMLRDGLAAATVITGKVACLAAPGSERDRQLACLTRKITV